MLARTPIQNLKPNLSISLGGHPNVAQWPQAVPFHPCSFPDGIRVERTKQCDRPGSLESGGNTSDRFAVKGLVSGLQRSGGNAVDYRTRRTANSSSSGIATSSEDTIVRWTDLCPTCGRPVTRQGPHDASNVKFGGKIWTDSDGPQAGPAQPRK